MMNTLTAIAIAQAAIQGIQSAAEAWPIVYAMFTQGKKPTDNEQAILDRGADDAHAALQLARTPDEQDDVPAPPALNPDTSGVTFHGSGSVETVDSPAPSPVQPPGVA